MAETAIPTDAMEYYENPEIGLSEQEKKAVKLFCDLRNSEKRILGQTDDELRNAGLKMFLSDKEFRGGIKSAGIQCNIPNKTYRIFWGKLQKVIHLLDLLRSDCIIRCMSARESDVGRPFRAMVVIF